MEIKFSSMSGHHDWEQNGFTFYGTTAEVEKFLRFLNDHRSYVQPPKPVVGNTNDPSLKDYYIESQVPLSETEADTLIGEFLSN